MTNYNSKKENILVVTAFFLLLMGCLLIVFMSHRLNKVQMELNEIEQINNALIEQLQRDELQREIQAK